MSNICVSHKPNQAVVPKRGGLYFRKTEPDEIYVLTELAEQRYLLVEISTGSRWDNPTELRKIFDDKYEWTYFVGGVTLTQKD